MNMAPNLCKRTQPAPPPQKNNHNNDVEVQRDRQNLQATSINSETKP